jgi:PhnB protein
MANPNIQTSIAPWLSVVNGANAIAFYRSAFGAVEVYRIEDPDGNVVAKLSIDGAEFWLSGDSEAEAPRSVRMILTVSDPDSFFDRAIKAGASQVFPVAEAHGWRVGRLADPFGHHWEIGKPVT